MSVKDVDCKNCNVRNPGDRLNCYRCGSELAPATGSAAPWVKHPWDIEEPMCVRCGTLMSLNPGCEWDDDPDMNLCHDCALKVIRSLRQNAEVSRPAPKI